jgi:hypothetical protein
LPAFGTTTAREIPPSLETHALAGAMSTMRIKTIGPTAARGKVRQTSIATTTGTILHSTEPMFYYLVRHQIKQDFLTKRSRSADSHKYMLLFSRFARQYVKLCFLAMPCADHRP